MESILQILRHFHIRITHKPITGEPYCLLLTQIVNVTQKIKFQVIFLASFLPGNGNFHQIYAGANLIIFIFYTADQFTD